MKQGDAVWVRDPTFGYKKREGIVEFLKGDQIVVSFSEIEYLLVFNVSQVVDKPTEQEIEMEHVNNILDEVYNTASKQDWNYHRIIEELGYKLIRQECR